MNSAIKAGDNVKVIKGSFENSIGSIIETFKHQYDDYQPYAIIKLYNGPTITVKCDNLEKVNKTLIK